MFTEESIMILVFLVNLIESIKVLLSQYLIYIIDLAAFSETNLSRF